MMLKVKTILTLLEEECLILPSSKVRFLIDHVHLVCIYILPALHVFCMCAYNNSFAGQIELLEESLSEAQERITQLEGEYEL